MRRSSSKRVARGGALRTFSSLFAGFDRKTRGPHSAILGTYVSYVRLHVKVGCKADRPALGHWHLRVYQLTDRRKDSADGAILLGEFFIQSRLELREAPGQLFVGDQQLAQLDERAHDLDVDSDCAITVEYGRQHGNALLGEGVGQIF